uniref:Uncharacterized protein n=1 Tax=Vespula pensylvanica TaxID=30213 RepID=A0A834U495_VESPE|nr:hypothetical protein H0235_012328 [Vespula pensylvanica]
MGKKVEVGGECQVLYGEGRRIESKLPPQHSSRRSSGRLYRACRRRMRDVGWDGAVSKTETSRIESSRVESSRVESSSVQAWLTSWGQEFPKRRRSQCSVSGKETE